MTLKESVAKAQLQLLEIQSLVQAEGWDKDPDWVSRDKGRFSSKNSSSSNESKGGFKFPNKSEYLEQISKIERLTKKDTDRLQKAYESLDPEDLRAYENFLNSPAAKQMYEDFSSAMESVSTGAAEVYDDAMKKAKSEPEPQKQLNAIQQAIKDHPMVAKVGVATLGLVAAIGLTEMGLLGAFSLVGVAKVLEGKKLIREAEFAEKAASKVGAIGEANRNAEYAETLKRATSVTSELTKEHGIKAALHSLDAGFFGLGAIAVNNELAKNEKEKAATRFGNQLDSKAFPGGEKQKQDFIKEIVEAVEKASKDFRKVIER